MNSDELYKKAYDLHYNESEFDKALDLYKQVLEKFPESAEAGYSKSQIDNINKLSEKEKERLQKIKAEKIANDACVFKDTFDSNNEPNNGKKDNTENIIPHGYIRDLLTFRRMITPIIIQIIFWLGTITCLILGFDSIFSEDKNTTLGFSLIFLGPIVLRLYSEASIVFFKMNETLQDISKRIN